MSEELAIKACPSTKGGVHQWIYHATCVCIEAGWKEEETAERIKQLSQGCGRLIPERELAGAWSYAITAGVVPETGESITTEERRVIYHEPPWPQPNLDLIDHLVREGIGLYDLWESSPVRFDDGESHVEEIVDVLFHGDPWLCVGETQSRFATRHRSTWRKRGLRDLSFIVPNPMSQRLGRTEAGRESEHTLEAVTYRAYLTIEFDFTISRDEGVTETIFAPMIQGWKSDGITVADACSALHDHLSSRLDLVCCNHSGGKSLHGWYRVLGESEQYLKTLMRYAVRLGADRVTWCPSQFVRLPDGQRDDGRRQTTYFFDPSKAIKE